MPDGMPTPQYHAGQPVYARIIDPHGFVVWPIIIRGIKYRATTRDYVYLGVNDQQSRWYEGSEIFASQESALRSGLAQFNK